MLIARTAFKSSAQPGCPWLCSGCGEHRDRDCDHDHDWLQWDPRALLALRGQLSTAGPPVQAGSEGGEIPPHPCSSWSSRGLQHCPPALRLPSCFSNQTAPLIALKPSFWSCCTLKRGESGVWLGFPCTLQADLENGNSKPYRSPQFWLGFGSCFCSSVGMSTLQRWIAPGQEGCKRRDTSQT